MIFMPYPISSCALLISNLNLMSTDALVSPTVSLVTRAVTLNIPDLVLVTSNSAIPFSLLSIVASAGEASSALILNVTPIAGTGLPYLSTIRACTISFSPTVWLSRITVKFSSRIWADALSATNLTSASFLLSLIVAVTVVIPAFVFVTLTVV